MFHIQTPLHDYVLYVLDFKVDFIFKYQSSNHCIPICACVCCVECALKQDNIALTPKKKHLHPTIY